MNFYGLLHSWGIGLTIMKNKLIYIAPYSQNEVSGSIATVVDFVYILEELKINYILINTYRKPNLTRKLNTNVKMVFKVLFKLVRVINRNDTVLFHSSVNAFIPGIYLFGPITYFLGAKFIVRLAGGKIPAQFNNELFSKFTASYFNLFVNSVCVQTLDLKSTLYSYHIRKVIYLPNYRRKFHLKRIITTNNRNHINNFIHAGRICKEKGSDIILKIFKNLGIQYKLDVWGTSLYTSKLFEHKYQNISYKGKYKSNESYDIISKYKVLIFYSNYANEGQPGIVLEALSAGLTVFSNKVRGVQELNQCFKGIKFYSSYSELKNLIKNENCDTITNSNNLSVLDNIWQQYHKFSRELLA
tara:strand:+ start:5266 stop:6336 length:1071 start_codon:yes stop_codon:yes gene_type:complete